MIASTVIGTVQATAVAAVSSGCLCFYWHQQVWEWTVTGGQAGHSQLYWIGSDHCS